VRYGGRSLAGFQWDGVTGVPVGFGRLKPQAGIGEGDPRMAMATDELADALSNPEQLKEMIEKEGWSAEELLDEAERAAQQLSNEVSAINVV
jgi:hypothetical protein